MTSHARPVSAPVDWHAPAAEAPDARALRTRYLEVRSATDTLCRPLETEDFVIQSMPDSSPTKWHIAHVSWFFETFVLARARGGYRSPDDNYNYLFNSYYNSVGPMHERPKRGVISRPTVVETLCYRGHVDEAMLDLIDTASDDELRDLAPLIELGLHHEQQHQ